MPFSEIEYTRRLGTWCDGIPLLNIEDIHRTAFRVSGVGTFPFELLPFEIDFYYKNRRDLHTSMIFFRFGSLVVRACKQGFNNNRNVQTIYEQRPRELHEWAVAVELTPSES